MEADTPTPDRRRAALGLFAVVGLVAAGGLAVALAQHRAPIAPTAPLTIQDRVPDPVIGLGFSVAYDVAAQEAVVFGGVDGDARTWLFDGHGWTKVDPATSPASRSGAAEAYDPESRQVMLFGGSLAPGKSADDTWAWDGSTWEELDSGVGGPPSGQGAQMAWDTAIDQMVLVTDAETAGGAETWTWTQSAGSHWLRAENGDLSVTVAGDVMAYDPTTQSILLVSPVSPDNGESVALSWDGERWRQLNGNGPDIEGLALNPQTHTLLGCALATYSAAFDVQDSCWEWTGFDWNPLQVAVPPGDSRLQLVVEDEISDPDTARILMFAWLTRAIPGQPQPLDVWAWDGEVWTLLA